MKNLTNVLASQRVPEIFEMEKVATGYDHSAGIYKGEVYCWGNNTYGQLGIGVTGGDDFVYPVKVVQEDGFLLGETVVDVRCGSHEVYCLTSDGKVYSWGSGASGKLGNGADLNSNVPVAVDMTGVLDGKTVTKIRTGVFTVLVIANDDKVYTWGRGTEGQLGDGAGSDSNVPVAVDTTGVLNGKTIVDISVGLVHSGCVDSDGKVYCWGRNTYGQCGNDDLGDSDNLVPVAVDTTGVLNGKTITKISFLRESSLCLSDDDLLFSWGRGSNGQLGNDDDSHYGIPVAVDMTGVLNGLSVTDIASGRDSGYCIADNQVFAWGGNGSGQLGNDDAGTSALVPVAVLKETGFLKGKKVTDIFAHGGNNRHIFCIANNMVYGWGNNDYGRLGDGTKTQRNKPVKVHSPGVETMEKVSMGIDHSAGIYNGEVYCWGRNNNGSCGQGYNSGDDFVYPVKVVQEDGLLLGKTVVDIACGHEYTLCLTSDGEVYGWGSNGFGQLGDGTNALRNKPVAVDMTGVLDGKTVTKIAVGITTSLVIASDDKVYAWGRGNRGQLGNNDTAHSDVPVAVDTAGVLNGKTIVDISCGITHFGCLDSDGKVYCWGSNALGQCGNDDLGGSDNLVPVAVDTSGVLNGKTITKLRFSRVSASCLSDDGLLFTWGEGGEGQLGNNDTASSGVPVAVDMTGVLSGKTVTDIGSGRNTFFCIADNELFAWGDNARGTVGNDNAGTHALVPVAVLKETGLLLGKKVTDISSSGGSDGQIFCIANNMVYGWGNNGYGELGDGTKTQRNKPVRAVKF